MPGEFADTWVIFMREFGFPVVMCIILSWAIFIQFPKTLDRITIANTTALDEFAASMKETVQQASGLNTEILKAIAVTSQSEQAARTQAAMVELRAEFARLHDVLRTMKG